jgi:hypothetical protein
MSFYQQTELSCMPVSRDSRTTCEAVQEVNLHRKPPSHSNYQPAHRFGSAAWRLRCEHRRQEADLNAGKKTRKGRRLVKSAAAGGYNPFARNRPPGRGMGSKGRFFGNCVFTSVRWFNQAYTKTEKHQPRPPQVPGCEDHPTACEWSSTAGSEDGKPQAALKIRHLSMRTLVAGDSDQEAEHLDQPRCVVLG